MSGCSIRALWILNNSDSVVFSRRFPVVEKRWRTSCKADSEKANDDDDDDKKYSVSHSLPSDPEVATAFLERKRREGSVRGSGVRLKQSTEGSDAWVDDPVTRHVISLSINKEQEEKNYILWPFVLHVRSYFCILVLPLVEPRHLKAYAMLSKRADCGNAVGLDESLSSLLVELPSITGAFVVGQAVGDIIVGDAAEPEIFVSATPSVGGLLDSLTGGIGIAGISSRTKPVAAPLASSTASATGFGSSAFDGSKSVDKEALRTFISSSMPFGTPLDLNYTNISTMKVNGFSSSDVPPSDLKLPAWKPYLYKGKQRIMFTVHETIHAAMYDRDEIPDSISVSGQVNCRAELEGLPDVSFPLLGIHTSRTEVLSFHPCAQIPEHGVDRQAVVFSPPLGNFVLIRYQSSCNLGPPVKGFYQLSMVSEDEGAFLFKLHLMEGYKAPLAMEFCTVSMPFPRRRVISIEGTPSVGTVSHTEHAVEWKIIAGGRVVSGKSIEATFPGTIKFAPLKTQYKSYGIAADEDSDAETESGSQMVNIEDILQDKMNKDLPPAELEEPFCWQAYDYAKLSFKIIGGSLSGAVIDPKNVSIYPAVKAPVELSSQDSVDFICFNHPILMSAPVLPHAF
ncbi:unnamed protein product [Rhodiola kirilowii]